MSVPVTRTHRCAVSVQFGEGANVDDRKAASRMTMQFDEGANASDRLDRVARSKCISSSSLTLDVLDHRCVCLRIYQPADEQVHQILVIRLENTSGGRGGVSKAFFDRGSPYTKKSALSLTYLKDERKVLGSARRHRNVEL